MVIWGSSWGRGFRSYWSGGGSDGFDSQDWRGDGGDRAGRATQRRAARVTHAADGCARTAYMYACLSRDGERERGREGEREGERERERESMIPTERTMRCRTLLRTYYDILYVCCVSRVWWILEELNKHLRNLELANTRDRGWQVSGRGVSVAVRPILPANITPTNIA